MAAKTRTKNFGTTKKIADFEPLSFTLNDVEFECRAAIQGSVLLEFVADADSDDGGRSAGALYNFFEKSLLPESYAAFNTMVRSEDIIVDLNVLGEIASWLVEEYTSRPTSEPKSS